MSIEIKDNGKTVAHMSTFSVDLIEHEGTRNLIKKQIEEWEKAQ